MSFDRTIALTTTRFRRFVAVALSLTIADLAAAQTIPAQTIPARLSAAQAQQDIDVARRSLEEAHGALYRFTPKPALDVNDKEVVHRG